MKYCCGKGIGHRPQVLGDGTIVWVCRDHREDRKKK